MAGASSVVWALAILAHVVLPGVAGLLALDLYFYYGLATVMGWLAGNVYMARMRRVSAGALRRRLAVLYLVGPPGLLYLLRALAPAAAQEAAPFVPMYALGIYGLFFLVPVTLPVHPTRRGVG